MTVSTTSISPIPTPNSPPQVQPEISVSSPPGSGFSQELSKAKSKTPTDVQKKDTAQNNPAAATPKKMHAKSAQGKANSKSQQKQPDTSETATDSESTGAAQATDAESADSTTADDSDTADLSNDATAATADQNAAQKPIVVTTTPPTIGNANPPPAKAAKAKADSNTSDDVASTDSPTQSADPVAASTNAVSNPVLQQATASATTSTPSQTADSPGNTDSSAAADDQGKEAPVKAKAVVINASAQAVDELPPDSSAPADSSSLAAADSPQPDAGKPADFNIALQTATQVVPEPTTGAHLAARTTQNSNVPAAPQTPVAQFSQANQPGIVSTIHGSLLPNGGTMNIALNPPDLGAMQITVRMENGAMSASFQTNNDQATRLLTHSLGQLKNALEGQGVSVDRLHVHQVSSSETSSGKGGDSESKDNPSSEGRGQQQEQQRRETLRRMWRRARGSRDPLDLVA